MKKLIGVLLLSIAFLSCDTADDLTTYNLDLDIEHNIITINNLETINLLDNNIQNKIGYRVVNDSSLILVSVDKIFSIKSPQIKRVKFINKNAYEIIHKNNNIKIELITY